MLGVPGAVRILGVVAAAAALAAPVRAQVADAVRPPPPPGVARSRVAPLERPPIPLAAALAKVAEPVRITARPMPAPVPGGATESEALRRYVRGRQRAMDGQPVRAAEDIDAALRLDPGSPELRAARADAAAAGGDVARAISEWEAVLALDPQDLQALIAVGVACHESGQAARAASLLGRAWPRLVAADFAGLSDLGRSAVGTALARSLFRLGFDEAGLEVAAAALEVPAARVAELRGGGLDAAERADAQFCLETGEAALRVRRPDVALMLFARSVRQVPAPRAVAMAAYAQLLAGDLEGMRQTVGEFLEQQEPWHDPEQARVAEWMLESVGGDPEARELLALQWVSFGRDDGPAAAEDRARLARLTIAAGEGDTGRQELAAAIAEGAADPRSLLAAFRGLPAPRAVALAIGAVDARPETLREACRALVRASPDLKSLRAALAAAPAGGTRDAVAAGVMAVTRASGDAWRLAEAAAGDRDDRIALEAMLLAAVAAADPALVARTASLAGDDLDADPGWHASLARAFAETGAAAEAEQSLARAELLAADAGVVPAGPSARALAEAHALVDGRAAPGSPRGRAESALSRGDQAAAAGELLLARELDPDDGPALAMLLGVLPRVEGPRAVAEWLDAQLRDCPNDPALWQPAVLQSMAPRGSADVLARIDARLAADPGDTLALGWREVLLRGAGRSAEAAAAARARVASLPSGPRRSLEEADGELQFGAPEGAVDALVRFLESAYPPPAAMRAAALDVARRVPASTAGRASVIRRIARDAILTDPRSSLEFYAFETLGAASDPSLLPEERRAAVASIAAEAAAVDALRGSVEAWRTAADFLLAQREQAAAAEFLHARLDDPSGLPDADLALLARAAVACDAAAGGRAASALALAGRLRGAGLRSFGPADRPGAEYDLLGGIFALVGDGAGAEFIMEAGLAVDPSDGSLLNNLGYARLERGLTDARTESLLVQAVAARPGDAGPLDSLGWLRFMQGRLADGPDGPGAVTLLGRAVAAAGGGSSAVQHEHLGDARWKAGDPEGARRAWEDARRLAEGGMTREQNVEVLRQVFRRQVGLAAVDAARYHDAHDGAVAGRVRAKLDAAARGAEPEVAAPRAGVQGQ